MVKVQLRRGIFTDVNIQSQSAPALRPVVTFLNHGVLPFVGREHEMARIASFWREGSTGPVLRVLLVTAEAGIGKSRIADEIARRTERSGAAVVHLRFYPDSSLSPTPLLSQSLRLSFERQQLLPGTNDQPGNVALLRRLAYLRPTVILLEDLHLLHGTPLRELQEILHAIGDLPISVVLLTRPVEIPLRGVIEPWLVDEFQLGGLSVSDIDELLRELFGFTTSGWMAEALHEATLGNPLAIRSALRAAVTSGALAHSQEGVWRIVLDRAQFAASLTKGVTLLTEGMMAHLSTEERIRAGELAELGEVFSRETAEALIPDARQTIDTLLFRGVLSPLELPISPLVGRTNGSGLIVFSHTLLHRSLVGRCPLAGERLVAPLAAGLPFYSSHVIEGLVDSPGTPCDPETARAAIEQLTGSAHDLDLTADWPLTPRLLDAAEALHGVHAPVWDPIRAKRIELEILTTRASTMRREDASEEYRLLLERFLRATEEPLAEELREYRIFAVKQKHLYQFRNRTLSLDKSWQEVEELIRDFPDLRFTKPYIAYLRSLVTWAVVSDVKSMARTGERRLEEIEATGRLDEELRRSARRQILVNLVSVFDTQEELERRIKLLEEIELDPDGNESMIARQKIRLLLDIGSIDELLVVLKEWIPRFEALGLTRNVSLFRLVAMVEPVAFGESLTLAAERARELIAATPESIRDGVRQLALVSFISKGILTGQPEKSLEYLEEFSRPGDDIIQSDLWLSLAVATNDLQWIEKLVTEQSQPSAARSLLRLLCGLAEESSLEQIISDTRAALRAPIFRTYSILDTFLLSDIIDKLAQAGDVRFEKELQEDIRYSIELAMTWLAERGMSAYMVALLQQNRRWLTRKVAESWQASAARLARERKARSEELSKQPGMRIRMLGSIEARRPDGTVVPIRGGRLRVLAGLLVADRILSRRLGHREFCRIASGEEDPERARKTMNGAVMRLRELLGEQSITTDGETPELNLSLVSVDLFEVLQLCADAGEAMRSGLLSRALPGVREALDIWNGDVPFPTLYESFFEAAREDFETRINTTTMTVSRALLSQDDPAGAAEILRRAAAIMPGDETIAALLIDALSRSGHKADAERLRLAGDLDT